MSVYQKDNASELSILEIAGEMGHSIQMHPDGTIEPAQDGETIPTVTEIEAYRQTAWDVIQSRKYKAVRVSNYPNVKEQLDKLWHDIHNGTLTTSGEFYTAIAAVKTANPKPSSD